MPSLSCHCHDAVIQNRIEQCALIPKQTWNWPKLFVSCIAGPFHRQIIQIRSQKSSRYRIKWNRALKWHCDKTCTSGARILLNRWTIIVLSSLLRVKKSNILFAYSVYVSGEWVVIRFFILSICVRGKRVASCSVVVFMKIQHEESIEFNFSHSFICIHKGFIEAIK